MAVLSRSIVQFFFEPILTGKPINWNQDWVPVRKKPSEYNDNCKVQWFPQFFANLTYGLLLS